MKHNHLTSKFILQKIVSDYNLYLLDEEQLHLRAKLWEEEEEDTFTLHLSIPNAKIKEEIKVNTFFPDYEYSAYEELLINILNKSIHRTL